MGYQHDRDIVVMRPGELPTPVPPVIPSFQEPVLTYMTLRRKYVNVHKHGFLFPYVPSEIKTSRRVNQSSPDAPGTDTENSQWMNTKDREVRFTIFLNGYGEYQVKRRQGYQYELVTVEKAIALLESFMFPNASVDTDDVQMPVGVEGGYESQTPLLELFTGYLSITCKLVGLEITRKMFSNLSMAGLRPGECIRAEAEITLKEQIDTIASAMAAAAGGASGSAQVRQINSFDRGRGVGRTAGVGILTSLVRGRGR